MPFALAALVGLALLATPARASGIDPRGVLAVAVDRPDGASDLRLVSGSGIAFEDRGESDLKGIGVRRLFAVA